MMKSIKKMLLVVLMFATTLSYAEKKVKRNTIALSKVAVVEFVNAKKGQKLLVKDEYGIILHSEIVTKNGNLSKSFNLKQLKNGTYTIELDKDFEVIIKPLEIKDNAIVFLKNKEKKVFKPLMRIDNDKLLISQMTLGSNHIEVEIYYDDTLIYSENVKGEKTMNRIYKFSDTESGEYQAIVKADDRTYIKQFKL